jgi:hypothetical protein
MPILAKGHQKKGNIFKDKQKKNSPALSAGE